MKNIKKLLALSLLLSIPSVHYAMEDSNVVGNAMDAIVDNAGSKIGDATAGAIAQGVSVEAALQGAEAAIGNIADKLVEQGLPAQAAAQVAEQLTEKVAESAVEKAANNVNQSWFSNPLNWRRPSMPDLGLQDRLGKVGSYGYDVAARALNAGNNWVAKPVYGAGAYALEAGNNWVARPSYQLGARALTAGNDRVLKPMYNAGAYGIDRTRAGIDSVGELVDRNPQLVGAAAFASVLGALVLYKYTHPGTMNLREQAETDRLVREAAELFERENAPEIARIKAEREAAEAARLAEVERIKNRTYSEYAAQYYPSSYINALGAYYPSSYINALNPWQKKAVTPEAAEKTEDQVVVQFNGDGAMNLR